MATLRILYILVHRVRAENGRRLAQGQTMNRAAQQLGRMAKGKPKTLTKAERKRRAQSLAVARSKRWPGKSNMTHEAEAAPGRR